jgi:outer membrane protein assembly factor BamB
LVVLTTTNFDYSKCESDGSDIRFSGIDPYDTLDYWIEEWNYNGDSKIWVEIDTIPTGGNICGYVYYNVGGSPTTESDGDETFELFDDFEGTVLDANKWETISSPGVVVANSEVIVTGGGGIVNNRCVRSKIAWQSPIAIRSKSKITVSGEAVYPLAHGTHGESFPSTKMGRWSSASRYASYSSGNYQYTGTSNDFFSYQIHEIRRLPASIAFYFNDVLTLTHTGIIPGATAILNVLPACVIAPSTQVTSDWILIRKYADPDPTFQLGAEEPNSVDFSGSCSYTILISGPDEISFLGYGSCIISECIKVAFEGQGALDISISHHHNNEISFFGKGEVIAPNIHCEYCLNVEQLSAAFLQPPQIRVFTDIDAYKVTNWSVNKTYDDCMWKLTAPVADLILPELYKNFRVMAKDHLKNEHCIFLGMVPDAEYKLNIAKKTSQITGWDYGFYLSRQKVPRSMWVPDEDINPATLVDSFLGSSNWSSVTGIEPYKIITVANWNTEKKQFKWNSNTSKWKAIQDIVEYCKYVFLVKWRETSGGFWYPVAYFVPEDIAMLDDYLDVPEMVIVFKDNSISSEVTGLGDFIINIVEPAPLAWPMFMQNLSHSGYKDTPTNVIYISSNSLLHAVNPDGSGKWTCPIGLSISAPIIDEDGVIYHGCQNNYLYAINPDGSEKWKYNAGDDIQTTPVMDDDGNIWYESDNWDLVKLSHDGAYICNGWLWGKAYLNSPTIGQNGHIYTLDAAGYLTSYNPDCSENWSDWWGDTWGNCCPAIAGDGTIYIGAGPWLCAMNPNGTDKWWGSATGNCHYCSPSIAADGTIYIGCGASAPYLYAFWPDGTVRWRYDAPCGFDGAAAIAPDGTIYFGADDGNLYAVNPDGTWKWTYATGDWIFGSPVIGSDGTIYIGSGDHFLHAINPDGSFKWKYDTGDDIWGSPAIA